MDIHVREAVPDDIPEIINFQKLMAFETENLNLDDAVLSAGVNAVFNNPDNGLYYVAQSDDILAASLMITYEWSDWRNGKVYWIQSVFVRPEFRKKGVFNAMYQVIKQSVISDKNVRGIRLYVDKTNTNAQKVYENIGMSKEHYEMYEWMDNTFE